VGGRESPPQKYNMLIISAKSGQLGNRLLLFANFIIKFLICSNLQQNPSLFDDFNCVFAKSHLIEDMYALAECDYIVHFYEWQGIFNYRDNWSDSFWDWTH